MPQCHFCFKVLSFEFFEENLSFCIAFALLHSLGRLILSCLIYFKSNLTLFRRLCEALSLFSVLMVGSFWCILLFSFLPLVLVLAAVLVLFKYFVGVLCCSTFLFFSHRLSFAFLFVTGTFVPWCCGGDQLQSTCQSYLVMSHGEEFSS